MLVRGNVLLDSSEDPGDVNDVRCTHTAAALV